MKFSNYRSLRGHLAAQSYPWLLTGVAGFIGSHLLEGLLGLGQEVVGLDNFSTGSRANLRLVQQAVGGSAWSNFRFVEGDLGDRALCAALVRRAPRVLHQAALGSVPRSLREPEAYFDNNISGFFNLHDAARRAGVPSLVYASSSSVYGDHPELPRREAAIGQALSPYAGSKRANEILAQSAWRGFGQPSVGLRYFNVFGSRQQATGPYAAVIPRWARGFLTGEAPRIHGDGLTTRDFCPVAAVLEANLLASFAGQGAQGCVFNVALGESLTLASLYERMAERLCPKLRGAAARGPFREGDVPHSLADLTAARRLLAYGPEVDFETEFAATMDWYQAAYSATTAAPCRSES